MTDANRAACVIGFPVSHSRSPLIHGYWLKKYGLPGAYRREEVPPEELTAFLRGLDEHGYVGGNVTLPHKEAALGLSEPDAGARAVGAANTLWLEDGHLRSTNTDVEGFLSSLDDDVPGWDQDLETALVLGAGGAARAVVYALTERGVPRILVANRTLGRSRRLRERFGDAVVPTPWDALPEAMKDAGLLVNATSLGMTGQPPLDIDLSPLPDRAVVADVVYVPLNTPLIEAARARGLRVSDGLGMLLHQAGRGFELWFGVRPEVTDELRALVQAEILKD